MPIKETLILSALIVGGTVAASPGEFMSAGRYDLIRFDEADRTEWRVINDGVMGGVSRSRIGRTGQGTGVFEGDLSLENDGGFASVRALLGRHDLSTFAGIEVRLRGDGRTYQLRLRTDDRFDGVSYSAPFETEDGAWTTVRIPFAAFSPTFRGRTPTGAPQLDTKRIHQLAFLLADGRPGPFRLEIESVRAWRADGEDSR